MVSYLFGPVFIGSLGPHTSTQINNLHADGQKNWNYTVLPRGHEQSFPVRIERFSAYTCITLQPLTYLLQQTCSQSGLWVLCQKNSWVLEGYCSAVACAGCLMHARNHRHSRYLLGAQIYLEMEPV